MNKPSNIPEIEITGLVPDQIIRVTANDSLAATITVKCTTSGKSAVVETTPRIAGMMLCVLVAGDEGFESFYPELEAALGHLPMNLRPIP